jgi:hypothetical protein
MAVTYTLDISVVGPFDRSITLCTNGVGVVV